MDVLPSRVPTLRRLAADLKKSGSRPLQICRDLINGNSSDEGLALFFDSLPAHERHYWIASLYALLMPNDRRRKLSAYFTPPHLAQHALKVLTENGIVLGQHRILDPASGGAAFLVPLAAGIAESKKSSGASARKVVSAVNNTLAGIEIEPELASLSKLLLRDILKNVLSRTSKCLKPAIKQQDSLKLRPQPVFDAVIVNPPYGRIFRPDEKLLDDFKEVITDGHVNRYALFARQSVKWTKPGGLVCLIIPMSFLGGPYFSELRKFLLGEGSVISLDPIEQRSELFMDVLCDVCVLTLRKHGAKKSELVPTSSLLKFHEPPTLLGNLDVPKEPSGRIWALPNALHEESFFDSACESLEDYGYIVKTGYFVWNREQKRYRVGSSAKHDEVPLYWAHNIKANGTCKPLIDEGTQGKPEYGFAAIGQDSPAVVKTDAIIVQRTSNSRQKRRLIAAVVRQKTVPGERGFVSENHTLLILPRPGATQKISLKILCRLLNTEAVDSRFRRISGTVSVSVSALRVLPLPSSSHVNVTFCACADDDCAADSAYALTTKSKSAQPILRAIGVAQ